MSSQPQDASASITAENQFTSPALAVSTGETVEISVGGTGWVANVRLQRSFDGSNWHTVPVDDAGTDEWTVPTEKTYFAGAACLVRLGCPTGDFTSGTIEAFMRLGTR